MLQQRPLRRTAIRCCLVAAILASGGCASHDRHLVASWYAVEAPEQQDPDRGQGSSGRYRIEDVYVAILNRGRARRLYGLRMNGRTDELPAFIRIKSPGGFRDMASGEVLILATGMNHRAEGRCTLPVSLQVNTKRRGRPRQIRVTGTMPTALPDDWLGDCPPRP